MLEFFKMSGAGNDFILGDNRAPVWDYYRMNRMVPAICARGTGVGADGVILLENSKKARFMIRIFNSDGLEADFCGNGLRCAARYAMLKVIAGKRMTIETRVGVAEAELTKEDEVLATFPMKASAPEKMELDVRGKKVTGYMVHAGVPHFVIFVKDAGLSPSWTSPRRSARIRRCPKEEPTWIFSSTERNLFPTGLSRGASRERPSRAVPEPLRSDGSSEGNSTSRVVQSFSRGPGRNLKSITRRRKRPSSRLPCAERRDSSTRRRFPTKRSGSS